MPTGITIIIIIILVILILISIFTVIKSRSILTSLSPLPALGFTLDKSALSGEQQPWCSCKEWDCCWSSPPSWPSPHPRLVGLQVQIMTTIAQNLPLPGDTHPIPLIAPRCYIHLEGGELYWKGRDSSNILLSHQRVPSFMALVAYRFIVCRVSLQLQRCEPLPSHFISYAGSV